MTLALYRIVYLPVGFAEAADRIVDLVERGVLKPQAHWRSREACQAFIDRQPRGLFESYAPTLAIIRDTESADSTERDGARGRDGLIVDHRALGERRVA